MHSTNFILNAIIALIVVFMTSSIQVSAYPVFRQGEEVGTILGPLEKRLSLAGIKILNNDNIALLGSNVNEMDCGTSSNSDGGGGGGLLNLSALNGDGIALLGSTVNKGCAQSTAAGTGTGAQASASANANAGASALGGIL